jgi:hypothetical protein
MEEYILTRGNENDHDIQVMLWKMLEVLKTISLRRLIDMNKYLISEHKK